MWFNTKILILSSIFIIILGLGFLWFGLKSEAPGQPILPPATIPTTAGRQASDSATQDLAGERVKVTRVVDGDTIVVNDKITVRFIGIDTPETVDPRRAVQCFGKEASNKLKSLLSEKEIISQKDVSETDKYSRLLRYIWLGDKLVNEILVKEGYAYSSPYPPDIKYQDQFDEAQEFARENKKGLWSACNSVAGSTTTQYQT